jgi:protein-export membrane protein SecD
VLTLAALIIFKATLTLPGIAGIILGIGMAVDSNVLIFERIREELRSGKTVPSAIDLGFSRAFVTIIDTHVTTIISSLFLFVFGTGPIRGFAVTLVLGLWRTCSRPSTSRARSSCGSFRTSCPSTAASRRSAFKGVNRKRKP